MANKYVNGNGGVGRFQSVGGEVLATKWKGESPVPQVEQHLERMIDNVVPMPVKVLKRRACIGMDINEFFPPEQNRKNDRATYVRRSMSAFNACYGCPVREECLQFAMDSGEDYGVWGGTPPWVRTRARRHEMTAAEVIAEDDTWRESAGFKEKAKWQRK